VEGGTSRFFNKEERRRPRRSCVGRKDETNNDDNNKRRWMRCWGKNGGGMVKRVKDDLWALEPSSG
jgi:hypothetical protein